MYYYGIKGKKALTDNTATGLFEIALPTLGHAGGSMTVIVRCTNGTDVQVHSDMVTFAAVNKAGAYTTQITTDNAHDADANSAGTLAVTYDILNGTNKVTIRITADTSLGSLTSFTAEYQVHQLSGGLMTPL